MGDRPDLEAQLRRRQTEARLRKGYRELFQEKIRPVLFASRGQAGGLPRLRRVYADALAGDESHARLFDRLKLTRVWYPENESKGGEADHIVFFSYRWINNLSALSDKQSYVTPDDTSHTQYRRMLRAIGAFLDRNPSVRSAKLGIWLDYACIDQESPVAGVSALPMNLAQCDAVISLVDEEYYTRAWCAVEVLMVQILRRAWGLHRWYTWNERKELLEGPRELEIEMRGTRLTYESEDRPKVAFLERQSQLLG